LGIELLNDVENNKQRLRIVLGIVAYLSWMIGWVSVIGFCGWQFIQSWEMTWLFLTLVCFVVDYKLGSRFSNKVKRWVEQKEKVRI